MARASRIRRVHLLRRKSLFGFSLLEIMVSMAILGLALTVILSAQGGLAASNRSAANMGTAETLARCKMSEIEEKTTKLGYQLTDEINEAVPCCDDKLREDTFICDTRVEKVVLPEPPQNSLGDGGALIGAPSASVDQFGTPINNAAGGPGLDLDAGSGLQSIGNNLQSQYGGVDGVFGMVMGLVYPTLKILMEASIRRVTVLVRWKEGPNARELLLVQYVTQPSAGGFIVGGADGGASTLPGASTSTASTSTASPISTMLTVPH